MCVLNNHLNERYTKRKTKPLQKKRPISIVLFTPSYVMSLSNLWNWLSELCAWVEALEVKDVSLSKVFFHLVEFIAADGVDVATLELLLEDLGNRDLTQVGAHAEEVAVEHETVLLILHLCWEVRLVLLLCGELLRHCWVIITVRLIAHFFIIGKLIIKDYNFIIYHSRQYFISLKGVLGFWGDRKSVV